MEDVEEVGREIIALSEIFKIQPFKACFVDCLSAKVDSLIDISSRRTVDKCLVRRLQSKILEPVVIHLRGTSKASDDRVSLIQYLMKIIELSMIDDVALFFHLYLLIFSQIFDAVRATHQVSEELKTIVFEAGSCLLKSCHTSVLEKVFKQESGEKYSVGIFLSVRTAKEEKSMKLRLEALNFLLRSSNYDPENSYYNSDFQKNLGDLFMLYLPGVVAPLQEIILRDETQHHLITLRALTCWGHIICLVMNDFALKTEEQQEMDAVKEWMKPTVTFNKSHDHKLDKLKVLSGKKRTRDWLEAASEMLKPLIVKTTTVRKHSNYKCRLELTKVMIDFHRRCRLHLNGILSDALDVIVGSTADENDDIRDLARNYLREISMEKGNISSLNVLYGFEKNIHSLINKLPGIIHSDNEKLLLPHLRSLSGHLRILGQVEVLRKSTGLLPVLRKLMHVIDTCLELEYYPGISDQDFSREGICDNDSDVWFPRWKRFRHFNEEFTLRELESICQLLGEHGPAETLIDCLLETYLKGSRRPETLLILNQLILGLKHMKNGLADQLLEFYLDPRMLNLPLKVGWEQCESLGESHSNIVRVALVAEGIRSLAACLGSEFRVHVLRTLYCVIELAGNAHILISSEGKKTAMAISRVCGLGGDVKSLVNNNIDYLTHHSVNKLKRNNSGVFDVVTVLISCSTVEKSADLKEIIENVLKTSSKNVDSPLSFCCLRLFRAFVGCTKTWTLPGEEKISFATGSAHRKPSKSLVAALLEDVKGRRKEGDDEEEEEEQEEEEEEREKNSESSMEGVYSDSKEISAQSQPPSYVIMTVSVASHCLKFLASKDESKKLMAVEILSDALRILAPWENELLPLVHKIWSPLVARFDRTSDPLLVKASFNLLCTLANTSKQFIRSRTLRSVLPILRDFLVKKAVKSKLKDSFSGYFFTQVYKLQKELLDNLGNLILNLELFEKEIDLTTECVVPYLSIHQPKELQEKSRRLLVQLKVYDPGLVWLKLQRVSREPEFSGNVQIILRETQKC